MLIPLHAASSTCARCRYLLFYPSAHPPFTYHPFTYPPTYLPTSSPFTHLSPLFWSPLLSFLSRPSTLPSPPLLPICSSTPSHIYPRPLTVYPSTHPPSPFTLPPLYLSIRHVPIHSSILPPIHPPFLPPLCLFPRPSIHINSFLSYINL